MTSFFQILTISVIAYLNIITHLSGRKIFILVCFIQKWYFFLVRRKVL